MGDIKDMIPKQFGQFMGIQTGTNVVNNAFGQIFAEHNRQRNFYWNEKAAEAADQRQRKQFDDMYSYSAQMKELEKAGLSPSMFFGGTPSQGGANAPQGLGAGGIHQSPMTMLDPMQAAQIGLIKAQTEKTEEETKTEAGTNERGSTMIESMQSQITQNLENAGFLKLSGEFKKSMTDWQNIQNQFAEENAQGNLQLLHFNIQEAMWKAEQVKWEAQKSGLEFKFSEKAFDLNYNILQATLTKTLNEAGFLVARSAEAMKHIEWYDKDMEQKTHQILQGYKDLEIKSANQQAQQKFWEAQARDLIYQRNYNERRFSWEKEVREREFKYQRWEMGLNFTTDLLKCWAAQMSNVVGLVGALSPLGKGSGALSAGTTSMINWIQ